MDENIKLDESIHYNLVSIAFGVFGVAFFAYNCTHFYHKKILLWYQILTNLSAMTTILDLIYLFYYFHLKISVKYGK
jgi:hypothetical protein